MAKYILIWALSLLARSCALSPMQVMSERRIIDANDGANTNALTLRRQEERNKKTLYEKKTTLTIKKMDPRLGSGSLAALDKKNDLFLTTANPQVGEYIDIWAKPGAKTAEQTQASAGGEGDSSISKEDEEMIKALPNLEPADMSQAVLLKSFKMRLTQRLSNGDFIATYERASGNENESQRIELQATIPSAKMQAGADILVTDLEGVKFDVQNDGELTRKRSSSWQNEYLLQISGFKEAKSKVALDLEIKRQKLEAVRDQLQEKIQSFGKERKQIAVERDKLLSDNKKTKDEVEELKKQNMAQKEQIEALKPKEQPEGATKPVEPGASSQEGVAVGP